METKTEIVPTKNGSKVLFYRVLFDNVVAKNHLGIPHYFFTIEKAETFIKEWKSR